MSEHRCPPKNNASNSSRSQSDTGQALTVLTKGKRSPNCSRLSLHSCSSTSADMERCGAVKSLSTFGMNRRDQMHGRWSQLTLKQTLDTFAHKRNTYLRAQRQQCKQPLPTNANVTRNESIIRTESPPNLKSERSAPAKRPATHTSKGCHTA